ncbi:HTH-type transcriptional regulator PuuR [Pelotomaculum schinkii]|uniref:HTH-type transcriptional regulator PuuR n=1 Tax=Pelotomaculum schinkii TaxID=78350 RepID=A0A4Y7R7W5_9FIRM|nr:helix-turn-helix transcriptional regulator [Pelotomaculum schinkii]TEB04783.1 HTH-type transcriptional regulator PuuR [Pelotomaculum schinkii]
MDIGQRIKTTREHQGISMNALSKKSGAAQSAISEIESGKRQPTFEVLEKIVFGLGLTLSEFFADPPAELQPDLRQMVDVAQKLTPLQRELLISVMKEMVKDNQPEGD